MTMVTLPGFPTMVSLVEGTAAAALDNNATVASVCRLPDGRDTDQANSDWAVCTTPTIGTANQ
jgi:hypothetical protein